MSLTSFEFFIMIACTVCLYYLLPLKFRFLALLVSNIWFILQADSVFALVCMLIPAFVTYATANYIGKCREKTTNTTAIISDIDSKRVNNPSIDTNISKNKSTNIIETNKTNNTNKTNKTNKTKESNTANNKKIKLVLTLSIICIAGFLIVLKDSNFFINTWNLIAGALHSPLRFPQVHFTAPIGISYYSLSWIGYLLDVYWGMATAENNILKFSVIAGYFPLLTSGPIIRYKDYSASIVTGHRFDYEKFCFGLQRILWGLMKKLVISSRLAVYVNAIYDGNGYNCFVGTYVLLAMVLFVFQLYTDFSGCIDIIIGISEMLGIDLPENFDLPFISRSLSEFWRRWHISIGAFLRDYILYSILKSAPFQKLGTLCKKKFGKKTGKKIPIWCGMLISWFLIGFWHGGYWNYIIGVGLFFGVVIILGEMVKPLTDKLITVLKVNVDSFGFHLFQCIRTFCLFTFGLSFFRSYGGFLEGLKIWRSALFEFSPWIFFDGSLLSFGLDAKDWQIIVFYMMVLAIAGIVRYVKKVPIRVLIAGQPLLFRWILYIALFVSVILFGCYGPGYDAQAFIYQQF